VAVQDARNGSTAAACAAGDQDGEESSNSMAGFRLGDERHRGVGVVERTLTLAQVNPALGLKR